MALSLVPFWDLVKPMGAIQGSAGDPGGGVGGSDRAVAP